MEQLLGQTAGTTVLHEATDVLPRLLLAAVLGGILAMRPWLRKRRPKAAMVQTQLLMCVAGALVACVIGDSVARAFGVVGLGGFIRFRSGLKDPRDAAGLFVLIGIGMACGMGLLATAVAGFLFVAPVFAALDLLWTKKGQLELWRVTLTAADPAKTGEALASVLRAEGLKVRSASFDPVAGRGVLDVEGAEGVLEALAKVPWVRGVATVGWERLEPESAARAAAPLAPAAAPGGGVG